jgi:hypothetical protein
MLRLKQTEDRNKIQVENIEMVNTQTEKFVAKTSLSAPTNI